MNRRAQIENLRARRMRLVAEHRRDQIKELDKTQRDLMLAQLRSENRKAGRKA